MGTINAGRVRLVLQGAHNSTLTYKAFDSVTDSGNSYVAKIDVPAGVFITNTTYWQVIAEKGDPGVNGTSNLWLVQSYDPTTEGNPGDLFLRSDTGDFWRKDVNDNWQLKGNITGPQGVQGVQGDTPAHQWDLTSLRFENADGTWGAYTDLEGPQGPTGATGPEGPQGPTGATGPAGADGADGSVWLSGSGAPSGSLGKVTDWYLNDSSGDVYEKTGSQTWTLRDNLTGPTGPTGSAGADGADGADGHEWFVESTYPASTPTGMSVGDLLLINETGTVYECVNTTGDPATDLVWTANIEGPTGPQGPAWTLIGEVEPTSDVGSISISGATGYEYLKGYATMGINNGVTFYLDMRDSGGIWRTFATYGVNDGGADNQDLHSIWFEVWANQSGLKHIFVMYAKHGTDVLDRSNTEQMAATNQQDLGYAARAVWFDEIRIRLGAGVFEGTWADRRTIFRLYGSNP